MKRQHGKAPAYPAGAGSAAYEWDPATDRLEWYGRIHESLGYRRDDFPDTRTRWVAAIHPDDRHRVAAALHRHFTGSDTYRMQYRIRHGRSGYARVVDTGTTIRSPAETRQVFAGVVLVLNRKPPQYHTQGGDN